MKYCIVKMRATFLRWSMKRKLSALLSMWSLVLILTATTTYLNVSIAQAEDWPAYLHDNHRSGATTEKLILPLQLQWSYDTQRPPQPAWDEYPALQDFWQQLYHNKPRVPVQNAFRVVVGKHRVYFGSSNSGKVTCLDARNGDVIWKFFTGGPVRFAPAYYDNKVYFGSDDGYVYCLNASDGSLVWKKRATPSDELMIANGRMISVCPVRSAVLVDNGVAYWSAGLFSGARTGLQRYLCACNAADGSQIWQVTPPKPLQGYPLASANNLYMPSGKSTPTLFRRSDGSYLGSFNTLSSRQGGAYALLTNDGKFFFGPHYSRNGSYIGKYDANTRAHESVIWGPGNFLVVTNKWSFYSSDTQLFKIDRSAQQIVWTVPCDYPYGLILAGDTLFAGGDNQVAAISTQDGHVLWKAKVFGQVHGLAVADRCLFVSTDEGIVYCFKGWFASVDFGDFAQLALRWLSTGNDMILPGDFTADGNIDYADLYTLCYYWLQNIRPDMVAHWGFDRTAGNVVLDSSWYKNDGTMSASAVRAINQGKYGSAIQFNGSDSYIDINGYKGISGGQSRTVTAWIKTTATDGTIVAWGAPQTSEKWMFMVTNGKLRAAVWGGQIVGSRNIADGNWHCVAVVLDNDSTPDISEAKLYVDGQPETISQTTACTVNTVCDSDVYIGVIDTTTGNYFNGIIDDVRIYDRALSDTEITSLYAANG